ncbi:hypothetical protein L208DRAFT_1550813 [Tricholoma matsutake]|nr:hypothetical protein L208DRAFT_1550813 [Tricholoma matsutake 945]
MQARNLCLRLYGQPELNHRCDKCTWVFQGEEVWVVVVDGVTVGHPCCVVHNCFEPLQNQRDHYCKSHKKTEGQICQIKGCTQVRQKDSCVCGDLQHIEAERIHVQHGQARFQLKECLERAWVAHPNDSVAEQQISDDLEVEEDIEIAVAIQNDACNVDTQWKKLQAQFGWRRTHNEELIVAPCGIVLAWQTFYGAEGVSSVGNFMKNVFCTRPKPKHIFFDNNCTLKRTFQNDEFFADIGLTVAVFHWSCKHST